MGIQGDIELKGLNIRCNGESPRHPPILININNNIFPFINHPIDQDIEAEVIPIA